MSPGGARRRKPPQEAPTRMGPSTIFVQWEMRRRIDLLSAADVER